MASLYRAPCPFFNGLIDFNDAQLKADVECPECAEIFRVVSLKPPKLTYAYDVNNEPDAEYPRS